jgi:hypothetical protein
MSIRENIARKMERMFAEMNERDYDSALERLDTASDVSEVSEAESDALRAFNLNDKQKRAWSRLTTIGRETMVALTCSRSSAALLTAMLPSKGRRGGWNQHTFEYLPSLMERLSGGCLDHEDATTAKLWPVLASMRDGRTVTREAFRVAYKCPSLNNIGGQWLSLLAMPEKGFGLLEEIKVGRAIVEYKPTDKLVDLLNKVS